MIVDPLNIALRRRVHEEVKRAHPGLTHRVAEVWNVPADIAAIQRVNYRHMRASGLSTHEARHIIFSGLVAGAAATR